MNVSKLFVFHFEVKYFCLKSAHHIIKPILCWVEGDVQILFNSNCYSFSGILKRLQHLTWYVFTNHLHTSECKHFLIEQRNVSELFVFHSKVKYFRLKSAHHMIKPVWYWVGVVIRCCHSHNFNRLDVIYSCKESIFLCFAIIQVAMVRGAPSPLMTGVVSPLSEIDAFHFNHTYFLVVFEN